MFLRCSPQKTKKNTDRIWVCASWVPGVVQNTLTSSCRVPRQLTGVRASSGCTEKRALQTPSSTLANVYHFGKDIKACEENDPAFQSWRTFSVKFGNSHEVSGERIGAANSVVSQALHHYCKLRQYFYWIGEQCFQEFWRRRIYWDLLHSVYNGSFRSRFAITEPLSKLPHALVEWHRYQLVDWHLFYSHTLSRHLNLHTVPTYIIQHVLLR